MDQVGPCPQRQSMKSKGNELLRPHLSQKAQRKWIKLYGRRIIGGLQGQAKVFGGWNSLQKNNYVDLQLKHENSSVEGKGPYNQMYFSEEF